MNKISTLLLAGALCAALAGCTARQASNDSAAASAAPAQTYVPFADTVAAQPAGSVQFYAESPYGPVSMETGPLYYSGLGNECRPVNAVREGRAYRLALCREHTVSADKAGDRMAPWRFVQTVFESSSR